MSHYYQRRVYGAKYRKELDVKEIAKRIRADIKIAVKSGHLPPELKASVKIRRFAGGQSIDVHVVSLPAGFKILNHDRVIIDLAPGLSGGKFPILESQAAQVLNQIKAYVNAYNYDGSDSQSDHYDVNFYDHVEFSHELRAAHRAQIEQEVVDRAAEIHDAAEKKYAAGLIAEEANEGVVLAFPPAP